MAWRGRARQAGRAVRLDSCLDEIRLMVLGVRLSMVYNVKVDKDGERS